MKLNELIADVIRDYKAPSLEMLRKWELMAIDLINDMAGKVIINQSTYDEMMKMMDNIEGGLERIKANSDGMVLVPQFLKHYMGGDWYFRMIVKFNEWKEKQDGEK